MVFSRSMTFVNEEIGQVAMAGSVPASATDASLLIDKLRSGDAAAFEILVERHSRDIYALLYRLTENAEEASDLTQDTFLRAFRSITSFRGDSEIKTWLFRIAINESRNRFRWWKRRRRDQTISINEPLGDTDLTVADTLIDKSISPEEEALARERDYALTAALSDVPIAYREAVVLCDIEGFSYEETATALGVGIGTVKSRISRGREELRRRLKNF